MAKVSNFKNDESYKYNISKKGGYNCDYEGIRRNIKVIVWAVALWVAAPAEVSYGASARRTLSTAPAPDSSAAWDASPLYTAETLEYYVHALGNSTGYTAHAPDWSTSFGLSAAFDYNVTAEATSASRGFIRGFEIVDSLGVDPMFFLVLNNVAYSDGYYVGSVSLHGAANVNETSYDIPIAGGSGSFRGAAGVAFITNLRTPGSDHVFRHVLHFTHLRHSVYLITSIVTHLLLITIVGTLEKP